MHLQLTMTFSTDDGLIGRNHIINQGRCVCFISSKILSFQHVINRNNYQNYFFFFLCKVTKIQCVCSTCGTRQFKLTMFQMLSSHMWLVATVLDGARLDHAERSGPSMESGL